MFTVQSKVIVKHINFGYGFSTLLYCIEEESEIVKFRKKMYKW